MDAAYVDTLDRKIPEDFLERKMTEWRTEEPQVKSAIDALASTESSTGALDAPRVLELPIRPVYSTFRRIPQKKPPCSE